jgi:hypothetical protein
MWCRKNDDVGGIDFREEEEEKVTTEPMNDVDAPLIHELLTTSES